MRKKKLTSELVLLKQSSKGRLILARNRNWAKYLLSGVAGLLRYITKDDLSLHEDEKAKILKSLSLISEVLISWRRLR